MTKKRILFIGDAVLRSTGYGCVARNVISNLLKTDKYIIGQLGLADIPVVLDLPIYYYTQLKHHDKCCKRGLIIEHINPDSPARHYLKVEPKMTEHENQLPCIRGENEVRDNYAYQSSFFVIQHFKPDIVIPINDLWGLYNIGILRNRSCYKFVPYLAIDSECLFPIIEALDPGMGLPPIDTLKTIGTADKVIVFTDWARKVINKTVNIITGGKELNNISIIPHGVDTSIWKPLSNKEELRKKHFKLGPNDFLIGTVSRNQPRKRFDANFMAIKKFIDKYEDPKRPVKIYHHCALEDKLGWNLLWLATYYGVADRCIFDKNLRPGMGPTTNILNEIVNCFDVHMLLSNSEGWGLSYLETTTAGIPNLASRYSAHADWGKDTLCFANIGEYEHEPKTGFIKAIVDTDDVARQLKYLYESKALREDYSKKGIKLGKKLDWSNVCQEWDKLLDTIDVSNLAADRYDDPKLIEGVQQQNDLTLKYFPE